MVLVLLTVAGAIAVGWLRGGRLRHLAAAPLRASVLVVVAAVAQLLHAFVAQPVAGTALTVASQTALLMFVWLNRWLAGALLIAVGSTLNSIVILANGAMPVAPEALLAIGRHPAEVGDARRHRLLTDSDALPWLADIFGLPLLGTVVSIGDVVLAAGIGMLVTALMRSRR